MRVLELFSGTRSIGKAFERRGHEVYSVDYDEKFEAASHADIGCFGVRDALDVCDAVNQHLMRLILRLDPEFWFVENPRAAMRRMPWMWGLPRYTVTYCQYGFPYMKPTDIWTNHPDPRFKPPCRNGDPCHEPAPRGSKSGLQAVAGKRMRGVIPRELCEHVVDICERSHVQRTLF